jgi:hypothetical protein
MFGRVAAYKSSPVCVCIVHRARQYCNFSETQIVGSLMMV